MDWCRPIRSSPSLVGPATPASSVAGPCRCRCRDRQSRSLPHDHLPSLNPSQGRVTPCSPHHSSAVRGAAPHGRRPAHEAWSTHFIWLSCCYSTCKQQSDVNCISCIRCMIGQSPSVRCSCTISRTRAGSAGLGHAALLPGTSQDDQEERCAHGGGAWFGSKGITWIN